MDDPSDGQGGRSDEATPARPTPVSARDGLPPPAARRKPTPARAMADTEPVVPSTVGEVVEEVSFLVGDEPLVARALGRSGRSGSSPLLLIGFWRDGEAGEGSEAGGAGDGPASPRDRRGETEHVREALVVAKDLADIGEDALRVAWREGRKPPAPPGAPPHRREQRRRR